MKNKVSKFLAIILAVQTFAMPAFADCDFATGISKVEGGYLYTSECHKKVGKVVQDLKDREEQVAKLEKTIELKDLAIKMHEDRAKLWMDTSFKLEEKVNTMESIKSTNQWLYFGLGVVVSGLAVWGAGQLAR